MLKKYKKLIWVAVVAALLVPAVWALFVQGFYGASDDIHIAWLYEFHKTLMLGQIPPRFVPDLSFGFGYPLFNFAFPLPFYLTEIFHILGFSLVDSVKILFFLSVPLSLIFMYLLLREFTSKMLSLAGSLLYVYTPYRSVDLYVRGAIGEIVSFIFLPLILLSVVKISKTKNIKWVGIGAIALASLLLSHNITAYMFFPFLGLFMILQLIFSEAKIQLFFKEFLMIFLALLISIYFWLPAIVDSTLMKYDTIFNFADHFPTLLQLVTPYWGYGASVPGPYDGMSFFLGSVNLAVLLIGLFTIFFYWKKFSLPQQIILSWSLLTIVAAIFLMNFRSTFIWEKVPLLPYFQFPWRFLILTTLAIPILVIVLEKMPFLKFIPALLIILIIATTGSFFRPQDLLRRSDNYFINRYIPNPVASEDYKKTGEEYLRLPKAMQFRPDQVYPRLTGKGVKEVKYIDDLNAQFTINTSTDTVIDYNKYYFPGWVVQIDNKAVDVKAGSPFGQINFIVPPGEHLVDVHFKETNFKKILDAISLMAFLVSLMLAKLWIRSEKYGLFS